VKGAIYGLGDAKTTFGYTGGLYGDAKKGGVFSFVALGEWEVGASRLAEVGPGVGMK